MGCIETKPSKELKAFMDHNIGLKDMIAFRQHMISEHYDVAKASIGHGKRGEVRKATHKATNQLRAVKIMARKNLDPEKFRVEANILRSLDHYNIARTYDIFQDNISCYIVSELCTGSELFEKIQEQGTINEAFAAKTMKQVLSAVSYMHKCGIIHRNLKPDSLRYLDKSEDAPIKITNFALADIFRLDDPKRDFMGTLEYVAPEMINGIYNTSVDVWACGVILYIMLSGTPPFTGSTPDELKKNIKEQPVKFEGPVWNAVSSEAKDLITKLLDKNLSERLKSSEALQHAWFKKNVEELKTDLAISKQIVGNLTRFRIQKKMQQAIWLFMVHYIGIKQDEKEILKAFKQMDKDHDGQLSKEELMDGMKNTLNSFTQGYLVNSTFEALDKNRSGYIEYTEFLQAMIDKKLMLSKENLQAAFKLLDCDENGSISLDEIKEAFGAEQILYDDDHWKRLIEEGDTNQDGKIDFEEFCSLMADLKV